MNSPNYQYAIVLVTFYPDDDDIAHLNALCAAHEHVIVIDNTPTESSEHNRERIECRQLVSNHANTGLSAALNKGIRIAGEQGIDDIFLFDQDSRIDPDYCSRMMDFKHQPGNDSTDFFAPNFYDTNAGTHARFAILGKWRWHVEECDGDTKAIDSSFAITSGLLISYRSFVELGDIREDYFIDHMDTEYCLRALCKGKRIIIHCGVTINHAIGNRQKRRFLGVTIKPNNHRALRRYYIARNGMDIVIRYFRPYPSTLSLHLARMIHDLLAITLYEDNKLSKLYALLLGNLHACLRKSGEYKGSSFS